MQNISKSYPGVKALDNVSIDLLPGEVHCLVGENGAGKSTLIKILSGAIKKDSGEIFIEDKKVEINSPYEARKFGIGVIYQDFKLVSELTIAENILLGNEPVSKKLLFINKKKIKETAFKILERLGENIDVSIQAKYLSVAKRQVVEIAKALSVKIKIIAMDEPTASLSKSETENLFDVIKKLKDEGTGIIYISHRIEEIFKIADRITVLRDGKLIITCLSSDADRKKLIKWMVGRDLEEEYPRIGQNRTQEILHLENINSKRLKKINLSLYKGEILGLAGLNGAGRSELANIIFGAQRKESGKIFFNNEEVNFKSPREAIDTGIALLTEDRNFYGLLMQMSVKENISISNLSSLLKGPFIRKKKEKKIVDNFILKLKIKTPTSETKVENLSGGNRQKVVLARWLFTNAKMIIFDEPTVGIDIGVKYEIYNLINRLVENNIGVMVISSDLPELVGICHRIAVMSNGEITGELKENEINQEKIMELAVVNL
jgi:ribose transport system ATP-binding protein